MTALNLPEFADAEVPVPVAGRLYLQNIPNPPKSLQLFKNGMLMSSGAGDFMLTGQVITPIPAPAAEDTFIAWYRC